MTCLIAYCRPGFEKECAAELHEQARAGGLAGYVRTRPETALCFFEIATPPTLSTLGAALPWRRLVFARALVVSPGRLDALPADDRAGPLAAALDQLCAQLGTRGFSEVFVETADTNTAKELQGFCRKFSRPLERALAGLGRLAKDPSEARAHVLFESYAAAYPGFTLRGNSSPWPMGIPRLRLPASVPSRSALKLEEALGTFLSPEERERRLRSGMHGVDLGAAPGGWSFVLAHRELLVTAVDNAALDRRLLAGGLVTHLRADGFAYRPPRPVDWMVCDMVEQPARIALLVARWLANGWCRHTIFNLKLPMKKRYEEVRHCQRLISEALSRAGIDFELAFRQLYHDREEVTGYLCARALGGRGSR